MIPFDFQYPSFTVYQHTVTPVLALLCKHIRHLNIEASGRTWDWGSFPFPRGSKLEMWRSGILVKSSLSIKLSIKILTLTTSKLFPDFCLTLKKFDLFLTVATLTTIICYFVFLVHITFLDFETHLGRFIETMMHIPISSFFSKLPVSFAVKQQFWIQCTDLWTPTFFIPGDFGEVFK